MRCFHIDLNHANPTGERLVHWLRELAALGYDTILWEVENAVRWDTCPACAAPDAFSKDEFRAILATARGLGLQAIPLFQTLGHCEYVLKHPAWMHLAEAPGRIEQYCPNHPALLPFLHRWIAEHLEVFGPVERFHVGMDEAVLLGACPTCSAEVARHGEHGLFVRHLRAVVAPLLAQGITPMIWADMALAHLATCDLLPREVELCDWNYFTWEGQNRIWLWSRRNPQTLHNAPIDPATLTAEERAQFGADVWPRGETLPADPCFTAHHLARRGFGVVACPTTSCYGDTVFAPRFREKLGNTVTWVRAGAQADLRGSIVTSWTCHQHPWELQRQAIEAASLALRHPDESAEQLAKRHIASRIGCPAAPLLHAWDLLSEPCLFSQAQTLDYSKTTLPVDPRGALQRLRRLATSGALDSELARAQQRRQEYGQALDLLVASAAAARGGHEILAWWQLAARNLTNRAAVAELLLRWQRGEAMSTSAFPLLAELRALRLETARAYLALGTKTLRLAQQIDWIYGSVDAALELVAAGMSAPRAALAEAKQSGTMTA
jgi:hypothetical protein